MPTRLTFENGRVVDDAGDAVHCDECGEPITGSVVRYRDMSWCSEVCKQAALGEYET
jgi:endogenous inhibitor of DNA gyrase (YacG/DUF329 family)